MDRKVSIKGHAGQSSGFEINRMRSAVADLQDGYARLTVSRRFVYQVSDEGGIKRGQRVLFESKS